MRNYYCVYDKKSEIFLPLFEQFSDKGAIANVIREIETGKGTIADYPEDYKLYKVLSQDESTGHVDAELVLLMDCAEVKYEKRKIQES